MAKLDSKVDYKNWSAANNFTGTSHTWDAASDTVTVYGYETQTVAHTVSIANYYSYSTIDQYIRQRTVNFKVTGLTPLATGFYLSFSGKTVSITPATGYSLDTSGTGTAMTDSNGTFAGSFTIPADVPAGTVEVGFTNSRDNAIANYTGSGNTIHQGTYYTSETYYSTVQVAATIAYDPLAETFQLPQNYYITSLNLFFGSKDDTEPVRIQIRPTTSTGYPDSSYYINQIIDPSDINVSTDGSVATNIKLDSSFFATANTSYAIVLASQSDSYTVFQAKLGEKYLSDSTTMVNQQPYVNGILFSSSMQTAFTPDNSADLKFGINVAKFNPTSTATFEPVTDLTIDSMLLLADSLTPDNTECTWYYRALTSSDSSTANITDKTWSPLSNFIKVHFDDTITAVQLRATFTASDFSSPIISTDAISLGRYLTSTTGNYIGKTIDSSAAPYNTIHLKYYANIPSGAYVTPYYSLDSGSTWKQFTVSPSLTTKTNGFTQYAFDQAIDNNSQLAKSFKIKLALTSALAYKYPRVSHLTCVFNEE